MENELFCFFCKQLDKYLDLWNKGLKKIANQEIKKLMLEFDNWDVEQQKAIIFKICYEICEKDNSKYHTMLEKLPYELSRRISKILYKVSDQYGMPYLRWCYELCGYDREVLRKAYSHVMCDEKTANYYFDIYIYDLWFGSHHFPEYSLITKETYNKTIITCEEIADKHNIKAELKNEYTYYKKLYKLWWEYDKLCQKEDFSKFCKERGLNFEAFEAYYYKK